MALSALSTLAFKIGSIPLSTSVSSLFVAANAPHKAGKVPDLPNTVAADLCRASAYSAVSELRQSEGRANRTEHSDSREGPVGTIFPLSTRNENPSLGGIRIHQQRWRQGPSGEPS